jgi:hypothetical protein
LKYCSQLKLAPKCLVTIGEISQDLRILGAGKAASMSALEYSEFCREYMAFTAGRRHFPSKSWPSARIDNQMKVRRIL